ncbi:hypothetical protein [Sphingobacterium sp. xlx-130]|uniref:hypothetical protein n=1 Tax=Sphingobacterium sp. xlx-130 TaxID=2654323 RepID=UPI0013DD5AD5|nr:hypothetical protein [Sphingobacterium sp. xlx-130]
MNIKNFALTGLLLSSVVIANAQQKLSDGTGDNGLTVNQNAILELASKNKGLLHTRVTLEATTKAYPMSAHVAGLMVYNTETRNDVIPGIYYNDGTKWVLASGGKATSISYNPTTYEISFVDVNGSPVTIDFKEVVKKNETITTLISIGEGKYEYTSENGTKTVINVPADVIQNFETIVKEENVKNEIINLIKNVGGNVYYDGDKFTYVTETGETKEITIKEIVAANETLTVLSYNQKTNALTYKDEKGKEEIINLNIGTIVYDSKTNTITYVDGNGGATPLTLNETSLVYDQTTKVLTYTDSKGVSHEIDLGALVAAHETVTTITEKDGVYTYTNEKKETFEINIPKSVVNNFETIVNKGPVTVNGDTFSTVEEYIQHIANSSVAIGGGDFVTVTGTGTAADPYKVEVKGGEKNTMLVTNKDGQLEWATIESIVKGNETVTTLVKGTDGKYTYTSEDNTVTVIDIPASIVENFETIVNKGPVTVNGDTFSTVEEYIQHIANSSVAIGGGDFVTVTGTGTAADPYKVEVKGGEKNTMLVTNKDGQLEWATIESIVKGNETVTVLVKNSDGTFTYYNESQIGADGNPKAGETGVVIDPKEVSVALNTTTNKYEFKNSAGAVIGEIDANADAIVYNDNSTNLGVTNVQGAIEKLLEKITTVEGTKGNLVVAGGLEFTGATTGTAKLLADAGIQIADKGVTSEKLTAGVGVDGRVAVAGTDGTVTWMSKTDATTNDLTLVGNKLTSTVNGKESFVSLTDANLTSDKKIESSNITVTGGQGATLQNVTLEVTAGTNGQVMVTKDGKTAWVDQSTIVPTITNDFSSQGNKMTSNVNGVSKEALIVNEVKNELSGTTLTTSVNGVAGIVDLKDAIQAGQKETVVAEGTGVKVETAVDGKVTTYTVSADPAEITLAGDVTGAANATTLSSIQGTPVAASGTKVDGQALVFNGTNWVPGTPKVDVANITDGKALTSTDLELSANAPTALLKTVSANIKTGAVTSDKILDGSVQGVDLNANVAGTGLTKNASTGALDVNTSAIETVLADGTISNATNGAITVTDGNNATFKNVTLAVKAESGVEIHDDKVKLGGSLTRSTTITQNANPLTIATGGSNFNITGLDKKKVQATDATAGVTQHLLAVGSDNVVKALKAAMPKFFYMPSIIIPTTLTQLNAVGSGKVTGDTFNDGTRVGTLNLYGRYVAQFGTTGTTTQPSSPGAPALPVLPAGELHYYVTWFDQTIFETVGVDANGVLTYTVKVDADITVGSFMNIVFAVKETN